MATRIRRAVVAVALTLLMATALAGAAWAATLVLGTRPRRPRCAADNGGSYVDCGTLASLEAYGFNKSPDVNYTNLQATATQWVSTTQNVNGGSAYKFDSADGKIVPIP